MVTVKASILTGWTKLLSTTNLAQLSAWHLVENITPCSTISRKSLFPKIRFPKFCFPRFCSQKSERFRLGGYWCLSMCATSSLRLSDISWLLVSAICSFQLFLRCLRLCRYYTVTEWPWQKTNNLCFGIRNYMKLLENLFTILVNPFGGPNTFTVCCCTFPFQGARCTGWTA